MSGDKPKTIRELIAASRPWLEKKGVDNPRLDAELLVAHALGVRRIDLFLDLDRPLNDDEIARCRALVMRRGQREPVAQIVGEREFYGLSFTVTPDVLVPRPETEHLVETALARTPEDAAGLFVDACTGTGCVAISILKSRPGLRAVATELSSKALAVAAQNAEKHGVTARLTLLEGDLLSPCGNERGVRFIVANPPYIQDGERNDLAPEVVDHEPHLALFGEGPDGLGHHRRILDAARAMVVPGGFVALEIGASQGDACRALSAAGFGGCSVVKDLAGLDRVAVWERAGST
jgi:release factor glutamine methyltransferase